MRPTTLAILTTLVLVPLTLGAQSATSLAVAAHRAPAPVDTFVRRARKPMTNTDRVFGRAMVGGLAAVGGAYLGAVAGVNLDLGGSGNCCGDDPGLGAAILGALVGTVAGGTFGSSVLPLDDHCTYPSRLGHSFAGALLGTAAGIAVAARTPVGLASIPAGSGLGAAIASLSCHG